MCGGKGGSDHSYTRLPSPLHLGWPEAGVRKGSRWAFFVSLG